MRTCTKMAHFSSNKLLQNLISLVGLVAITSFTLNRCQPVLAKDYYYTRTREDPNHLRVAEEFKNNYVNEIKRESKINGTKYEYYKSTLTMSHDELVFETIDKIFRHRLSSFYMYHYDNDEDKKRSSDARLVSDEACARDLLYLVDKMPTKQGNARDPFTSPINNNDDDENHLSPELTAFFDSYARQEPGLLMGNTYWVGAYDQCVNRHIFELQDAHPSQRQMKQDKRQGQQQVISFRGRYCVAALRSPSWDAIIESRKQSARHYFKTQRQIDDYAKLFRLQLGICLPSSCDSSSFERHTDEIKLLATSQLEQRYSDYDLADLYCLPDETSPLRSLSGSALLFVVCMVLWCLLLVLATCADLLEIVDTSQAPSAKSPAGHRFVVWFSLRANYRKLMLVADTEGSTKEAKPSAKEAVKAKASTAQSQQQQQPQKAEQQQELKINLRFLNAFKVMIMFWIVNGHIMLLMIQTAKNILYSDALLNGLMHFLIGATFGVDLFFTMTGFLTSYLIFNSGQAFKLRPLTWIYLFFHRYWRLAPMYLISFWFSRSVAQLLGSGPLWDYGTSALTFRGLCNHESWWYPLTLTSNLHGLFEECMITTWYISCDMQFWLASPIFIYLLAKRPLHGWIAALSTIIMSSKIRFDAILTDPSARYDELVQPRADIFMRVSHDLPALYTHPHYRISAYLVGLLAGHYVYMLKTRRWSSSITADLCSSSTTVVVQKQQEPVKTKSKQEPAARKTRQLMAYTGLTLFTLMSFISYILSHYYPSSMLRYARTVAAIAYSVDHLAMSVGASLIIISMCFGQWPAIVRFLSHPAWTRLSKMNYALLLLQCEAIYYQIFRYDQVPVAGTRELINILFNLLVTLYPLAFAATLVFEFPLANMEKLLI